MSRAEPDSAKQRFGDALALYDLRAGDSKALVTAATNLLTKDMDSDDVVALASKVVTPLTSPFEMDDLITAARDELHMAQLDPERTAVRAAQAQVRRWERGELSDRQLTAWAHQVIGHQGPDVLYELVVTDDRLDGVGSFGETSDSVRQALKGIAHKLLAHVDPWSD